MHGKLPRTPVLSVLYQQYLDHQDSARFAKKLSQHYSLGTLQRLAQHDQREVRRAAVLALGLVGDFSANHAMGDALSDDDRLVRMLAESGIRVIWTRVGNKKQQRELDVVMRMNASRQYESALRRSTQLIEKAPDFAEAWNQRAVARFNLGHFTESIRDCHHTLELNPYHFVAATSMGHAYLQLGNYVSALESFRRALSLNPDLESIRVQVALLTRMVEGR
jgi:tetratricopeptide (TPR) repeat protein